MSVYARVLGTGGYLPDTVLTNRQLAERVETSDGWIVERTGIHERRVAGPDDTVSSLAEQAARQALDMAGIAPGSLDLIILGTSAPERFFPSTACLLQSRLGVRGIPAFDVQAACSGFIYALSVADQFIRAGSARRVLVVGSEINSRVTDWTDRSSCILFGDGAGAVVLEAADQPGILSTHIHADGSYQDLLYLPNPVMSDAEPATIHMKGNEVFKVAVNTLEQIVDETLEANGLDRSAIDWLVPHQANIRIINATARKLKMPMERVVLTIARQGNTSAASVPLAFNEAVRDGRIQRGQLILMEAFGAGFAWGSALLRF